jgi:hypothetical protein
VPARRIAQCRSCYLRIVFLCVALCGSTAFGGLPNTPFSGQILNAGHFSQPATTAIGHRVIAEPSVASAPLPCAPGGRALPDEPRQAISS